MKNPHADGLCVCLCRFDLMFDRAAARLTFGLIGISLIGIRICRVVRMFGAIHRCRNEPGIRPVRL